MAGANYTRLGLCAFALAGVLALSGAASAPASAGAGANAKTKGKGKKTKAERKRALRRKNARQKRPNVVVIMTDDQNNTMEGLPFTQRALGATGTNFRNSYVSFPLCCPSRATFLTGQYSHNHGVFSTELPNGYNGLNHANTLPGWLRTSGYRTAMVGKYLNGYGIDYGIDEPVADAREIPPGWAEWYGLTGGLEQRRYKYKLNEQGKIRFYKRGARNYVTDVLASKAVDFVKRRARFPKPFFLWFNPTAPHGEAGVFPGATRDPQPAPRHLGRYEFAQAPRTPNFNEADVSDKPNSVAGAPKLDAGDIADVDRRERGRLESLLAVDDAVKRIVGKLRKSKDMRKTYIVFTSDNGLLLGSHRLRFKNYIYEETTRVPLIVSGPKFPRGATRDQLVSNVDLAPTIAQLAKVAPGLTTDGRSLVPVARNPGFGTGREILFESTINGGSLGIRSGPWVYLYNGPDETPELYNLNSDPFQVNSLHANPAYASLRNQLAAKVSLYRNCSGLSCP
ncbi:sulfatase [soil metagenome]